MATFAVVVGHGPGWDDTAGVREQRGWDEHAAFMDGLVDDGLVVLGGPLDDGGQVLLLVEARDEEDIHRRLAADPWRGPGLLTTVSVRPWALWLDSRR